MLNDSYVGITVLMIAFIPSWVVAEFLLARFKRTTLSAMGVKKGTSAKVLNPLLAPRNDRIQSKLKLRIVETASPFFPGVLVGAVGSYAIAGLAFACTVVIFFFLGDQHTPSPLAFAVISTTHLVPGLLAVILVAGYSIRKAMYLVTAYFALFLCLNAISTIHPESINSFVDGLKGWAIFNGLPILVIVFILHQRIRGVAPLILALGYIAVLGINAWVDLSELLGFSSVLLFLAMTAVTTLIVGGIAWKAIGFLANSYTQKAFSDQRLSIHLVFLIFATSYVIPGEDPVYVWLLKVFALFLTYLLTSSLLLRLWAQPKSVPQKLLILRVFSLGKRGRSFFRNFAKLWRRVGTTSLLAGPDLLEATVEPNEFLLFLSGNWKKILAKTRTRGFLALTTDTKTHDPDGLYRVNEYFCRDDNWQNTMVDLARSSDVVLMDVRELNSSNLGSLFELQQLMNYVELDRIVLLSEGNKKDTFLQSTLQQLWVRTQPDSVNRNMIKPEILVYMPQKDVNNHIPELVSILHSRSLQKSLI